MGCPYNFYACHGCDDLCVSCAESEKLQRLARARKFTRGSILGQITRHREAVAASKPTANEIRVAQTPAGGWTKIQLAAWGVPWPPPSGWRKALERKT